MKIEKRRRSRLSELFEVTRDIFLPSLAVLGYVGTVIGLYQIMDVWAVVVGLVVALGVCIYWWRRCVASKVRGVPTVLKNDEVLKEATKLLRGVKTSLHYYGGIGFIGKHPDWEKAYDEKLNDDRITIVRFLDAKKVRDIKTMLERNKISRTIIDADEQGYVKWLETHARNLKERGKDNFFFDFEGAPIWKYGIHYIIFDEKDVVITFLSSMTTRSAIFIRDCPDTAKALVESLDSLVRTFQLKEKNADWVAALAR